MKYLLLICADPTIEPPEEVGDIEVWFEEIAKRGVRLDGDRLQPPDKAKSVRIRGGSRLITDGPFAETKEMVAGFYLIEARDLAEAAEIAARIPSARFGTVEVRPTRRLIVDGEPVRSRWSRG